MNVLIIEDEEIIAQQLEVKILAIDPNIKILNKLRSVRTATNWLNDHPEPDLIFADIQLTDGISFDIFDKFALDCPVIFTTAYDEYALRAFKVNGIDYLLKPMDDYALELAINKAKNQILIKANTQPQDLHNLLELFTASSTRKNIFKEKFIVKHLNKWVPIFVADIAYFSKDTIIYAYTFFGEKFIINYDSMEEIEELVDPDLFFRANRKTLVNARSVDSYRIMEGQKLFLSLKPPFSKELIDISREKAPIFRKWFDR